MKIISQIDTKIRAIISTTELLIIFICIQKIIIRKGIHMAINEFKKNLHLIKACLSSHFIVNHKFENVRLMLFITASHAE